MAIYDKPVRSLVKDMADAFALQPGEQFTKKQTIDWFAEHYPKIKTGTLTAHLVRLSTNAPLKRQLVWPSERQSDGRRRI